MILITGSTGFVGNALSTSLARYIPVRISVRDASKAQQLDNLDVAEASMSPNQDWKSALAGISVVVHCAARVHVMKDSVIDPLFEFRQVNLSGTLNLARQASIAGVQRFIFISSIKVSGESTDLNHPFSADQPPAPSDPYGISKYDAEIGLRALSRETGMEVVIIRAPLIYGPGVKANFLTMMKWLRRGIPLPLGGVTKNRRSFVFIENFISMIVTCINHPAAANQVFMVSDDEDMSTSELLRRMALALGRPTRLIFVPVNLLAYGAKLIGRHDIFQRLCGSLQVDIKKTKDLLGWSPPVSVDEGLRRTAVHFLKMQS
ncbi:SDR family oxidoreductase [Polynucleobacter sp. AP-Nickl1-40-C4]|uniref:UDP-glucose 4-epimerase family protein n=1 Tax=Polynucleobacter sp. AP-Nickl1-40-C4 TaxID=3108275 RepID=UPI002B22D484|nr:SDR family oxidoreductase [Polynucleobacter sp. AP-Nickl1-40-C4]MEA9568012.1 SDR family oxidoreductase [Polynucleobacter sp. AP-Nickl1-40-C4]